MEGEEKKSNYIVDWAVYDTNKRKDALDCGVMEGFDSKAAAREWVFKEIKSYIEREDYSSDEEYEQVLRKCIWRGYENGTCICEAHCGVESIYKIVEVP